MSFPSSSTLKILWDTSCFRGPKHQLSPPLKNRHCIGIHIQNLHFPLISTWTLELCKLNTLLPPILHQLHMTMPQHPPSSALMGWRKGRTGLITIKIGNILKLVFNPTTSGTTFCADLTSFQISQTILHCFNLLYNYTQPHCIVLVGVYTFNYKNNN